MLEKQRLVKLFKDHYNGNPWLDVNISHTLADITSVEAAINYHGLNSIWQITKHLIEWRKANMKRASGIIQHAPSHNFIYAIVDTSDKAWNKLKSDFDKVHLEFIDWLHNYNTNSFDKIYEPNQHTYYEHIQGVLQHDAYHLGQIVILKRLIRSEYI
jgi:uncharacterized damage-inducible protein DinB